jgi:hypothetical protein
MGAVMNDFEKAMALVLSEGLAKIESLSDEEVERIINEPNLAS